MKKEETCKKPSQISPIKGGITAAGYEQSQVFDSKLVNVDNDPENEYHKGYDLKSTSQEVVATAGGTIVYIGESQLKIANPNDESKQGMGYVIMIDYGNGYIGSYGHMDSNTIGTLKVFDTVTQGQDLGKYTKVGNSTGAHLHYQINKLADDTTFSDTNRNSLSKTIETMGYSDYKDEWIWTSKSKISVMKANFPLN